MDDDKARESRERLIDDGNERKTKTKNHSASVVVVVFPSPFLFHVLCLSGGGVVMSYPSLFFTRRFPRKFFSSSKLFNSFTQSLSFSFFLSNCFPFLHHSPTPIPFRVLFVLYYRIVMHHHQ